MRKRITENNVRCTAAGFMLIACILTAPAYGQMPQQPAEQSQAAAVDSALLEKAADAYLAITRLENSLRADLEGVEDQEKIEKKVADAQAKVPDLLASQGLNEAQYQQVIQAVNQNPDVRDRFVEFIEKKQPSGNTPTSRNQQETPAGPIEINEEQLRKAAMAYRSITELNQQTRQKMDHEDKPGEIQKIVAEAKQVQSGIIEKVGLTEQAYGQIIQQISNNQALMDQFMSFVGPVQ